jgi:hypothetical protein
VNFKFLNKTVFKKKSLRQMKLKFFGTLGLTSNHLSHNPRAHIASCWSMAQQGWLTGPMTLFMVASGNTKTLSD